MRAERREALSAPTEKFLASPDLYSSPGESMLSSHAIVNGIVSMIINFGLNLGASYLLGPSEFIGIWRTYGSASSMFWSDILITGFLIVGATGALVPAFIHKDLGAGKCKPVRDEDLQQGLFSCMPLGVRSGFKRWFLLTCQLVLIFLSLSILALIGYDKAGNCLHTPETGDQCLMSASQYRFGKATWCMLMSMCSYPFIRLAIINRKNLPDEVYDSFLAASGVDQSTSDDQMESI